MKKIKVCILDYGSGNVKSVYNMIKYITNLVTISNDKEIIDKATHLILPGVGAFKTAMEKIREKLPLIILTNEVFKKKKPFLGICVGMQVLASKGFEFEEHSGLDWIPGKVTKLHTENLPLPHIGWNDVQVIQSSLLTKRFTDNQDFYFVHSYVFRPKDKKNIVATTNYAENFCSIINQENIYGVQFHPEKSQKAGKILLENFLQL